jgi:hypothetical protein
MHCGMPPSTGGSNGWAQVMGTINNPAIIARRIENILSFILPLLSLKLFILKGCCYKSSIVSEHLPFYMKSISPFLLGSLGIVSSKPYLKIRIKSVEEMI